jgi:16S rRNA (guanine527-N7)-methyltransferase
VDIYGSAHVSRETLERLQAFHDLLVKWNNRINLVSKRSVSEIWDRHIWDSVQILEYVDGPKNWTDLGSGGGFPGIVAAICLSDAGLEDICLLESDQRKAAFLREVIRHLDLPARVLARRIEEAPPQQTQIVSARALAELPLLLDYVHRHLAPGGTALLMKGAAWQKEVEEARESWSFSLSAHKSKTDPSAAILALKDIRRA